MVNTQSKKNTHAERCHQCLKIGCDSCPAPRKGRKHIAVDLYTYDDLNELRMDYCVSRNRDLMPMTQFMSLLCNDLVNGVHTCVSYKHKGTTHINVCPHH